MPKIPSLTANQIIKALKNAGFIDDRQTGSHLIMYNQISHARTVVPVHGRKGLKKGLIYAIIKDTRMTVEEFLKLL